MDTNQPYGSSPSTLLSLTIVSTCSEVNRDNRFRRTGLGHVYLLASLLTRAESIGIEVEAAYVASAQACSRGCADLSRGTVFYLYTPFTGSILERLRRESLQHPIRICTLGPCTDAVARTPWLQATATPDLERITLFHPRSGMLSSPDYLQLEQNRTHPHCRSILSGLLCLKSRSFFKALRDKTFYFQDFTSKSRLIVHGMKTLPKKARGEGSPATG